MLNRIIRQAKLIYSSSPQAQALVKKITCSTPYFRVTRAKIKSQIKKDKKGPFNLVIETSNFCNARCLMCPYPIMKREKKIMDREIFEKIISRTKKEPLPPNKVFFSGMGEPLIDPQIVERIGAFKKLGCFVKIYTNASLLTPKISQQLVDLDLDEMNISFNGVTPEQYQKVMGLNFAKTVKNINELLKIKKRANSQLPIVRISSIITKENERDIQKHIQNWLGKVDSVTVSLPHEWGGAVKVDAQRQFQKTQRTYPCRSLWHTFNIDSSGNFVICCRDFESQYILGNVHSYSFADIQKSPALKDFQQAHLKFSQNQLPKICQNCNFPYQDGVEWYLPRSID